MPKEKRVFFDVEERDEFFLVEEYESLGFAVEVERTMISGRVPVLVLWLY